MALQLEPAIVQNGLIESGCWVVLEKPKKNLSEIPKVQKRSVPRSLEAYKKEAGGRNEAIVVSYRRGGFTLAEIGGYYSLHYSTVSRIIHKEVQK